MRSDYIDKSSSSSRPPASNKAPRGLGIKTVFVTMLVVAGILVTAAAVLVVGKKFWPGETTEAPDDFEAAVGQQLLAEQARLNADTDGDGLTDLLENIYRSDPNQADTDGDGTSDGDEVEAGRDPATAGPEDNLDLEVAEELLAEESYSKKYIATLSTDIAQEDLLNEERIRAFIETVRGPLVNEVTDAEIITNEESDAAAVKTYLDAVSANTNSQIAVVTYEDIDKAFRENYQLGQSTSIDEVISSLQQNVAVLEDVTVPEPAVELHKQLLGASRALLENVQLLKRMPEDLVGGLLAAKNIEDLGDVFAEIAGEVAALEAEYNLE